MNIRHRIADALLNLAGHIRPPKKRAPLVRCRKAAKAEFGRMTTPPTTPGESSMDKKRFKTIGSAMRKFGESRQPTRETGPRLFRSAPEEAA